MDAAEPPRIVFESPARCADGRRAEELLREGLAHARAPGRAWVVAMRIDSTAPGVLRADGLITDDQGTAVGHRVVIGKAGDCRGLARAIGVWASLVLEGEISRPPRLPVPVAASESSGAPTPEEREERPEGSASPADAKPKRDGAAGAPETPAAWVPPPPGEKPPSRREEGRSLEVGAGGFFMSGMTGVGGGFLVGATPFLVIEVARGVFLRPAIAVGRSLGAAPTTIDLAAVRLDACARVAGLYTNLHGMQLDICGGADGGMLNAGGRIVPYGALGPSLGLRGELGSDLAVLLRGIVNVNVVHDNLLDTPGWAGRAELAVTWMLP